ncbi:MAG: STAS domain-containing protein [Desulfuromonas sp.]
MTVFDLPARLDATNAPAIEQQLLRLIQTDKPALLVCNFAATDYISSAGLRILLLAAKTLRQQGAELQLRQMQPAVAEVFRLAGLHGVLNIQN